MDISWRTVQIFLEEYGVVEAEVDQDNHQKVRCSCPVFQRGAKCKHTKYVKEVMSRNNGHYSIQIHANVDEKTAFAAMNSSEEFHDFVVKYAKVEVID
jgi:hypothetical protein